MVKVALLIVEPVLSGRDEDFVISRIVNGPRYAPKSTSQSIDGMIITQGDDNVNSFAGFLCIFQQIMWVKGKRKGEID